MEAIDERLTNYKNYFVGDSSGSGAGNFPPPKKYVDNLLTSLKNLHDIIYNSSNETGLVLYRPNYNMRNTFESVHDVLLDNYLDPTKKNFTNNITKISNHINNISYVNSGEDINKQELDSLNLLIDFWANHDTSLENEDYNFSDIINSFNSMRHSIRYYREELLRIQSDENLKLHNNLTTINNKKIYEYYANIQKGVDDVHKSMKMVFSNKIYSVNTSEPHPGSMYYSFTEYIDNIAPYHIQTHISDMKRKISENRRYFS
jgi:hypothetical protein